MMTEHKHKWGNRIKPEDKPLTLEHVEEMAKDLQLTNDMLGNWLRLQFMAVELQKDMIACGVTPYAMKSLERMGCVKVIRERAYTKYRKWHWRYTNVITLRERNRESKLWVIEFGDDEMILLDGIDEEVAREKFKFFWHERKLKKITEVKEAGKSLIEYEKFLGRYLVRRAKK